jgi:hypothetical protein
MVANQPQIVRMQCLFSRYSQGKCATLVGVTLTLRRWTDIERDGRAADKLGCIGRA